MDCGFARKFMINKKYILSLDSFAALKKEALHRTIN
jgi:hypothetical protein